MSQVQANLSLILDSFAEQGLGAEPIVFGRHGKREATILPYDRYRDP